MGSRSLLAIMGVLAATTFPGAASAQSEAEMRDRLCADIGREVPVGVIEQGTKARRARVDCLSDEFAIEIDFSNKWAEAFGQAAFYASQTDKKAGVILLCRDDNSCLRHGLRLESILAYLKIPTAVWWCSMTAERLADCVARPQYGQP